MPQLGESVTEGTIARWLKQPGDHLQRYDAIAEVVTDKVNAEIPAPADGVMGEHLVEEGAVVAVGAPICVIDSGDGSAAVPPPAAEEAPPKAPTAAEDAPGADSDPAAPAAAAAADAPEADSDPPAPAAAAAADDTAEQPPGAPRSGDAEKPAQPDAQPAAGAGDPPSADASGANGGALHVTPAVRMLAREHGIDLTQLEGTGLGGRVTKKDVLTVAQQRGPRPQATPAAAPTPAPAPAPQGPAPAAAPASGGGGQQLEGDTLVPLTQARRAIAEHMVRSKATSPHAWTTVEVDMTRVARARARHRAAFEQATGVKLTFLPFVARATITALRRHPILNSTFTAEGIVLKRSLHLGIAVALEDSLIVPVIRDADRLSLAGLAQTAADLGQRARAGRLRIEELTGGTFTLNNTGALGLVLTQPIINQPQAAILAMDAIVKRPVVTTDDAIAVRSMMNLSISFDHRVIDGLAAARFVKDIKEQLEAVDDSASLL